MQQFEGPLDLLLDLIKRKGENIETVSLAEITGQYLEYLEQAEYSRIDLDAEFVYMAATLIELKSRVLLGRRRIETAEPAEREIIDRLREHERARQAAELLKTRLEVEGAIAWREPAVAPPEPALGYVVPEEREASLADLIDLLKEAFNRVSVAETVELQRDQFTLEDALTWLNERAQHGTRMAGSELLAAQSTRIAAASVFLGILEYSRQGRFRVEQHAPFEEVWVTPN